METEQIEEQKPNVNILILGLDDAGKTSLLYKLKLGEENNLKIIPTIGYNVETLEFQNKKFTFWDIGGLDTVRVLWKFYAEKKSAVIFVVDASNSDRFTEAKDYLHSTMTHEVLNNVMLFVVANKQDKDFCLSDDVLEEKLNLKAIKQDFRILKTSAFDQQSLNHLIVQLNLSL